MIKLMFVRRNIYWLFIVLLSIVSSSALFAKAAAAQTIVDSDTSCVSRPLPYYDAQIEPPVGAYDVYVQMGKRGQTANVTLYAEQAADAACVTIGSATADSTSWQPLGLWQAPSGGGTRLQLDSEAFVDLPDANRPTVMLVPHDNPPCKPTIECQTTVEGQDAFIIPTGTILSEDSLHVTRVVDPDSDSLVQVDYYADGQFLYSTKSLQPFDLRYVPGGDHTLSRVMQYKSKQQVVLQQKVYISFASDFRNYLFRLFNSNKVIIQILTVVAFVAGLALIALAIIHGLHRRRLNREHHGLVTTPQPEVVTPGSLPQNYVPPAHYIAESPAFIKKTRRLLPLLAIAMAALLVVIALDSYIVQIFRVDGVSMEKTLQTDDKLLVSKVETTLASLNRQQYVPRRGEVVVFHKAHSEAFKQLLAADKQDTYVVKRVIGLPGERVIVKDGVITIINAEHPDGFQPDKDGSWRTTMVPGSNENLDISLGPEEVFVMGDNRPGSLDSRTNGPIRINELVGRARARIFPINKYQLL